MGQLLGFLDILKQEIKKDLLREGASRSEGPGRSNPTTDHTSPYAYFGHNTDLDSLSFTPLLNLTPPPIDLSIKAKAAYQVKAKEIKAKPRLPYQLNNQQALAMERINFLAEKKFEIKNPFSDKELKSAWRMLSKIYHPDLGGSPELFISLKKSIETLGQVLGPENNIR